MTEEKKKNREWVKNAAIIFLIVLLFLTFFSNTIMNRSLPEVSVKYAESGTITTRIRGNGTVEAVESYDVIAPDSRKVRTVGVQVDQEVAVGDVLFVFSAGESEELQAAKDTLKDMQLAYQKALISATETDYAKENRNIQKLKDNVTAATAERDNYMVSDYTYSAAEKTVETAEDAIDAAEAAVEKAQTAVDDAQEALDSVSVGNANYTSVSYAYNAWQAAKDDVAEAEAERATAMLMYGTDYQHVVDEATALIVKTPEYLALPTEATDLKKQYISNQLPVYLPFVANGYKDATNGDVKYYTAYTAIAGYDQAVAAANASADSAHGAYVLALGNYSDENEDNSLYYEYKDNLENAKTKLKTAQKTLTATQAALVDAKEALADLDEKKANYKTASSNLAALEISLEDAVFDLAQSQKSDDVTIALQNLDLQAQRDDIAQQQQTIAQLESGSGGLEIISDVYGVVKSINVTAGNTTNADQVMATIEVPDRGYQAEMSVTIAQSKKVTVGDFADVTTGYWGQSDITARLANIRTDTDNPKENRLLVFDISGEDVESGNQLSLSLGQKSQSFECIVPNSSLRSDSNGDFIYIITAKSTPLGNRYTATRVDVQILAKDDVNSAVTGVAANDYVITTSTKPIEKGMQVRMADS